MARPIHVVTVHWREDRWIDIQLRFLERFCATPPRVYAFLNGLERDHSERFFYASSEPIRDHATKLNLLGDMIALAAHPDDFLVFLDGDALPIAPLDELLDQALGEHEVVAVRRAENGDLQPHPCFCAMRAGLWRRISGDWHHGHRWRTDDGRMVTDVGANLMATLEREGIAWEPLLRSNRRDLHPLLFGVYGDAIYHHGGGFRPVAGGRAALAREGVDSAWNSPLARALDRLPAGRVRRQLRHRLHPGKRRKLRLQAEVGALSDEFFERVRSDPDFYRELI